MFLQSPFKDVIYELVGDSLALQFFVVDRVSGRLYQRRAVQYESTKATEYKVGVTSSHLLQHMYGSICLLIIMYNWLRDYC